MTYFGLPVIGFAVQDFVNGTLSNTHRSGRVHPVELRRQLRPEDDDARPVTALGFNSRAELRFRPFLVSGFLLALAPAAWQERDPLKISAANGGAWRCNQIVRRPCRNPTDAATLRQ